MELASYQLGSGSDGGAMAALAPAAVNMAKFGVLTRLGQTGDRLVDPGHVSRRPAQPAAPPARGRPEAPKRMLAFPPRVDYTSHVR